MLFKLHSRDIRAVDFVQMTGALLAIELAKQTEEDQITFRAVWEARRNRDRDAADMHAVGRYDCAEAAFCCCLRTICMTISI